MTRRKMLLMTVLGLAALLGLADHNATFANDDDDDGALTNPGASKINLRDRTSYSFNAALAAQAASPFNFEIEPENIILIALRAFEFSHSPGQSRK